MLTFLLLAAKEGSVAIYCGGDHSFITVKTKNVLPKRVV
jgi:hypothetical protein